MGAHFVLSGTGLLNIAYFTFCIVAKVKKLEIFNQCIHYQVGKIKNVDAWRFNALGLSLTCGRDKYAYFRVGGNCYGQTP